MRAHPPHNADPSKNLGLTNRTIQIWTSFALILFVVMVVLGLALLQEYQRQRKTIETSVAISVRPVAQLQRELLRLLVMIENDPEAAAQQALSLQRSLVVSRYNFLFEPYVSDEYSPEIFQALTDSSRSWEVIQQNLDDWMATAPNESLRLEIRQQMIANELAVNDVVTRFENLLARRSSAIVQAQARLLAIFGVTSILFLLFAGIIAVNVARLLQERRRAISLLQEARSFLEERVQERTAELTQTNRQLAQEIAVRQQAEEKLADYSAQLEKRVEQRTRALHQAQARLIHQEKLAALGELAGSVAHELRNPLGIISNAIYYLKLLVAQPGGKEPDVKISEYLGIIDGRVHQAEKIVTEMIAFASIRAARPRPCTIKNLAQSALAENPAPAEIRVETDIPPVLPTVSVDPEQIGQVLEHLLMNAFQAMPGGGTVHIRAWAEEETVYLAVEDTGSGIPPEALAKIFEPLFTTKVYGIGLGLAVCKLLLAENNAEIAVSSQVGTGTEFTITFPVHAPVTRAPEVKKAHGR